MRLGISQRLSFFMAVVGIISVLILAGFMYVSTRNLFSQYVDRNMSMQAQRWVAMVAGYYEQNGHLEGIQNYLETGLKPGAGPNSPFKMGGFPGRRMAHMSMVVIDEDNRVVGDSTGSRLGQVLPSDEANRGYPVRSGGREIGRVLLPGTQANTLGDLEWDFLKNIGRSAALAALIAIIFAVVLSFFISSRISRPVARLATAAGLLASGDLAARASVDGDREIAQLAKNFNLMAEKLQQTRTIRENLTADIIHELKTPLAILRGNLESMQSGVLPVSEENILSLQDEAIRLGKLVEDLELLSRAETGNLSLNLQRLPITLLLESLYPIINTIELEDRELIRRIAEDLPDLYGDKYRLQQVLVNLLSNALAYTPKGGQITLEVTPYSQDYVQIKVSDTGPGIDAQILPYVFDRFYRGDKSRSRKLGGRGLGLAIAKGLTEAHHGWITADSTSGKGSSFYVVLPVWKGQNS